MDPAPQTPASEADRLAVERLRRRWRRHARRPAGPPADPPPRPKPAGRPVPPKTSRFRGVSLAPARWGRARPAWLARIKCRGVWHHLGYFRSEEEAALAYDEAARRLHGAAAAAMVNFTEGRPPREASA